MVTSQVNLPAPRTWSAGDLVTVPRLRADVTNAVALLAQRPYFVGQRSLGDSWAAGSDLALPMDVELTDTWNGHLAPPSTGTAQYWCPLPGWYLADARIPFNYTSATAVSFECGFSGITNGVAFGPIRGALTVNGSTSGTIIPRAVDLLQQQVSGSPGGSGDWMQATARQDSAGSVSLQNLAYCMPTVSFRWVCANSGTQPLPVPPLTAVPTPITSAWLNANVRDTVRFLAYPPIMKAHYTAGTSTVPNNSLSTAAVINLTTVDVDNYGGFTTGAAAKYTIPVAGRYLVAGQINFAASSTATTYACGLLVNGTTLYYGGIVRFAGTGAGGATITKRLRFSANDTVQLVAVQQSGAALAYNTSAGNQTRMLAVWEGI